MTLTVASTIALLVGSGHSSLIMVFYHGQDRLFTKTTMIHIITAEQSYNSKKKVVPGNCWENKVMLSAGCWSTIAAIGVN